MSAPSTRSRALRKALALAATLTVVLVGSVWSACGSGTSPVQVRLKKETAKQAVLGFPALATKNTTRVGGKDPVADAAGVASAVYPGRSPATRPRVVSIVNSDDWRTAIAASALMAPPLRAPVLLGAKDKVPEATQQALTSLKPLGSPLTKGAQVLRIGDVAPPRGLRTEPISGGDPFALAGAIDLLATKIAGQPSPSVVVASADDPKFAMPAAGWAAKSGDPVLFVRKDEIPAPTRDAIKRHEQPSIYVLGPSSLISDAVLSGLGKLGHVKRISGRTPVENAIAFARYSDGDFGWGVRDPGHGLVFANTKRVQDAAAGAALGASGKYGPLLLTDSSDKLPPAVVTYLLDIQPGYRFDPVRGVYNHAWLMGDESAISVDAQSRIDELMEIVHVKRAQS
jgi:ell wall binding domain 2 (CWB2)